MVCFRAKGCPCLVIPTGAGSCTWYFLPPVKKIPGTRRRQWGRMLEFVGETLTCCPIWLPVPSRLMLTRDPPEEQYRLILVRDRGMDRTINV